MSEDINPRLIVIQYRQIDKIDHFYEDPESEYGTEYHSLETKKDKVIFIECNIEDAYRKHEEMMEYSASDPPYTNIYYLCAYYKETKTYVANHEFEYYARRNDDGEII